MVKKTFINLNSAKKQKIEQVMLDEFSNYDLNQANVARIVKEAGIARGAFYTYFDDLEDAYLYCLLYTSPSPRDRQKSRMPSSA